jgi:hypothetical protein
LPFGLEEPSDPSSTVIGEFKKKILFVTSMRDMPDMTRQEIPIGSRQVSPLLSPPIKDGPILFISVDPPKVADLGI